MSNRIHIIVKREPGDYWAAYCLDFTLYAVGDTADDARQKLLDIVNEYVEDATTGADRDYRDQLLGRRAPLRDWAVFFALRAWRAVRHVGNGLSRQALSIAHPLKHA